MGYYTDFELTYDDDDVDEVQFAKELADISDYPWDDSLMLYDAKWYDYDKNMKQISQMYPNTVFKLQGNGEENGDLWVAYYKDGKVQSCQAKITFDPYDESKLK